MIFQSGEAQDTERGSVILEAAIVLPLLIVGILTLGYSMRLVSAAEEIVFTGTDEARRLSLYANEIPWDPWFPERLTDRINDGTPSPEETKVRRYLSMYPAFGYNNQISFCVVYMMDTHLPLGFVRKAGAEISFLTRGFVGRSDPGTPMGFDEMEKTESGEMVYVFPRAGEKYHRESCRVIASYSRQSVLTEDLEAHYTPCSHCLPQGAGIGTLVFYFPAYGESYHTGFCPSVTKYVIEMSRSQAEYRGYEPCGICGGE